MLGVLDLCVIIMEIHLRRQIEEFQPTDVIGVEAPDLAEVNETEKVEDVEILEEEDTQEESSEETKTDLVINASLSVRAADIVIENGTGTPGRRTDLLSESHRFLLA